MTTPVRLRLIPGPLAVGGTVDVYVTDSTGRMIGWQGDPLRATGLRHPIVSATLDADGTALVNLRPTSPPAAPLASIVPVDARYRADFHVQGAQGERLVFQVPDSVAEVEASAYPPAPPGGVAPDLTVFESGGGPADTVVLLTTGGSP